VCNNCSKARRFIPNYSLVKEARICDRCAAQAAVKPKDELDDEVAYEFTSKEEELKEGQVLAFGDGSEDVEPNGNKVSVDRGHSLSLSKNANDVKESPAFRPLESASDLKLSEVKLADPANTMEQPKSRKSVFNRGVASIFQHPAVWFIDSIEVPVKLSPDLLHEKYALVKDSSLENIKTFLRLEFSKVIHFPPSSKLILATSGELQTLISLRFCSKCSSPSFTGERFCGKCGTEVLGDPANAMNMEESAYKTLWLLFVTEAVYSASLEQLVNDIARELVEELHVEAEKKKKIAAAGAKKNIVLSSEQAMFFSTIAQMHTLHQEFRKGLLRHAQVRRFGDSSLGEYLSQLVPFFGIYEDFILNLSDALRLFEEKEFLDYLSLKSLNHDHLEQLIRYPLNRLQQYGLFLEAMLETSADVGGDNQNIKTAMTKLQEKISYLRSCVTKMYDSMILKSMEAEFATPVILTVPGRKLLLRGKVDHLKVRVQGKKKKPLGKLELILFTDCLMEASVTKEGKLDVVFTIPLFTLTPAGLATLTSSDEEEFNPAETFKLCTTEGVELWFSSFARDAWIEEINKAVDQFMTAPMKDMDGSMTLDRVGSDNLPRTLTHYNSGTMKDVIGTLRENSASGGSGGTSRRDQRRKSATLVAILGAGVHSSATSFIGSKEVPCHGCQANVYECQSYCCACGVQLIQPRSELKSTPSIITSLGTEEVKSFAEPSLTQVPPPDGGENVFQPTNQS
jgi:predicted amidophosphoribosyltransferase